MRPFRFSCVAEVWKSELMPYPSSCPPSLLLGKWSNCIGFCKHCMTCFSWSKWWVIQKVKSIRDPHAGPNCAAACSSRMWELDEKKGWVLKSWCLQIVVLEKVLESPVEGKEIKPVNPKGNQSWIFIGKDPDAGKDWKEEDKSMTEDEMVGWHLWLNRRKFEWTLGVGDGQGGLLCCIPWGHKESDTTEQLNWTEHS